ncbi:MAG: DUF6515 family protein [Pseudomonadales bacterium]|nr:DUF6515 family protein [Pseudomonadales bacterium]
MKALRLMTPFLAVVITGSVDADPLPPAHSHHKTVVVKREVVVQPTPLRSVVALALGDTVTRLPVGHLRLEHRGQAYFYHDGLFYQRQGRGFVVVRPVAGMRISKLPRGYTTVRTGNTVIYRYRHSSYRRVNGFYVVV